MRRSAKDASDAAGEDEVGIGGGEVDGESNGAELDDGSLDGPATLCWPTGARSVGRDWRARWAHASPALERKPLGRMGVSSAGDESRRARALCPGHDDVSKMKR